MPDLFHSVMCHSETAQDKNNNAVSWHNTPVLPGYLLHMTLTNQQLESVLQIRKYRRIVYSFNES